LGETVGFTARLAQNNEGLYETHINSAAHRIHIALMGDPTLRLHPVVPPSNLEGRVKGDTVALTWTPSTDTALIGYHVYRGASPRGPFARLTRSPIAATSFSHPSTVAGAVYMVRAIKLESTTSGNYENASQGAFWSPTVDPDPVIAAITPAGRSAPDTSNAFSPDAAPSTGSANTAALTIASSGSTTSRDGGTASGESVSTSAPNPPEAPSTPTAAARSATN
jgi:hypothetical protein